VSSNDHGANLLSSMLETEASVVILFHRKLPSGTALYRQSYILLDLACFDSVQA
jgi:hypothetical protein